MPIHVLHILPHRGGGGETYIDMLERMPDVTHERFCLSSGRTPGAAAASIPTRWPRLAIRAMQADVVHAHGDMASVLALPLLSARPSVITTHGLHLLRRSKSLQRVCVAYALRRTIARTRAVICTSAAERDLLLSIVRPPDESKLTVIRNGIDAPSLPSQSERREARAELGVDPGCVLGLFVGQLEARKGPLLAASAAWRAREAGASFVLVLAGEGPQAADLARLAGEAVKPLGYRRDVSRLFGAADVFIAPAEREGLSIALLQAMGHSLAVVASDGPGNPEALGDAGLTFPVGDESALSAALARLASDPELRASLGSSARKRVLSEFTSERLLERTASTYARAYGEPATGPRGRSR